MYISHNRTLIYTYSFLICSYVGGKTHNPENVGIQTLELSVDDRIDVKKGE